MPEMYSTTRKIAQTAKKTFWMFVTSLPDVLEFRGGGHFYNKEEIDEKNRSNVLESSLTGINIGRDKASVQTYQFRIVQGQLAHKKHSPP